MHEANALDDSPTSFDHGSIPPLCTTPETTTIPPTSTSPPPPPTTTPSSTATPTFSSETDAGCDQHLHAHDRCRDNHSSCQGSFFSCSSATNAWLQWQSWGVCLCNPRVWRRHAIVMWERSRQFHEEARFYHMVISAFLCGLQLNGHPCFHTLPNCQLQAMFRNNPCGR